MSIFTLACPVPLVLASAHILILSSGRRRDYHKHRAEVSGASVVSEVQLVFLSCGFKDPSGTQYSCVSGGVR
ncbi:hypothetical protein K505DRAFT_83764 [Melanomma pulvis-pyrius CBS 109.77]|uniref:Secreted protein n=1 Tax=Melanomma pulvis-pyrius CBS 109.77 TaxID=1314802 RepID=A0A6A6X214_9PLEO|nr:hypothetical protein K505DRAFT_83764 [Melanomma pulvis-pyrius CBS 109.77]